MVSKDPAERALIARIAAHARWAKCTDRTAATAKARKAAATRFERAVDPNGDMDEETRAKAAENAAKQHALQMARKSAQARRRKSGDQS